MKLSIFPVLLSLVTWSSQANSLKLSPDSVTTDVPVVREIRIELPDYRDMFEKIQNVKSDKSEFKRQLLGFYSSILPVLRESAFTHRIYEAEVAYSLAEPSGYDLVKLHLMNVDSMSIEEYEFFERVVLNNSFSAAQSLVLELLPQIPETIEPFSGDQVVVNNSSIKHIANSGGRYE